MASVWKGSISFGLVNINIELYSAIRSHSLGFKLLHAKCHTPITYKRWCERCGQEVEWEDIVKGLKLEDGSYFIITKENLEKLKPEKSDYINIIEFIDKDLLLPIYSDKHYYIAPANVKDKSFFLFCIALEKMNKLAIGQFTLREKEYICAISPFENALLLTTLNYGYEIKHVKKIEELKAIKVSQAELKLAQQLISKLEVRKFDINRFKDTFAQELLERIKRAHKRITVKEVKRAKKIEKKKEPSLIAVLQASLKGKESTAIHKRA